MKKRMSVPLALGLVLLTVLLTAPAALAVETSVRVEAKGFTALPQTWVDEAAAGGTYHDSEGTEYTLTEATAFGATALATEMAGVTWDFDVFGMGPFVGWFSRQAMDPATYADWWSFAVNGYSSPLGAANLPSVADDDYLWFQNPDNTFSKPSTLLVIDGSPVRALTPGRALNLTIKGDDLAKVNSQADATRFGISDPSMIQTPDQFPEVAGATVYVGNRASVLTGSRSKGLKLSGAKVRFKARRSNKRLDLPNLGNGTYYVWAEKAMDGTVYARSDTVIVNVGSRPAFSGVTATPKKFRRNRALTVQYRINKAARVQWWIKSGSKTLARGWRTHASGGRQGFTWTGRTSKRIGKRVTVYLKAWDEWSRVSTVKKLNVSVRK